jgi:hypothetical protein
MNTNIWKAFGFSLLFCMIISGCASATVVSPATQFPLSTETPTPLSTDTPTPIPTDTPTLTPSITPSPTPTIEPPEILSQYLIGVKVNSLNTTDNMKSLRSTYLNVFPSISIQDGKIHIVGQGYKGGLDSKVTIVEGLGVIYDFSIISNSSSSNFEFETYFDNNQQWMTNGYRRFGIYLTQAPQTDLWIGKNGFGNYLNGNLIIKPNNWYRLALAVGNGGNFLCVIWDPSKPDQNRYFHELMGKNWSGNNWKYVINGAAGEMLVDKIMNISFESMK